MYVPRNGPLHDGLAEGTVEVEHLIALVNSLAALGVQHAVVETVDERH